MGPTLNKKKLKQLKLSVQKGGKVTATSAAPPPPPPPKLAKKLAAAAASENKKGLAASSDNIPASSAPARQKTLSEIMENKPSPTTQAPGKGKRATKKAKTLAAMYDSDEAEEPMTQSLIPPEDVVEEVVDVDGDAEEDEGVEEDKEWTPEGDEDEGEEEEEVEEEVEEEEEEDGDDEEGEEDEEEDEAEEEGGGGDVEIEEIPSRPSRLGKRKKDGHASCAKVDGPPLTKIPKKKKVIAADDPKANWEINKFAIKVFPDGSRIEPIGKCLYLSESLYTQREEKTTVSKIPGLAPTVYQNARLVRIYLDKQNNVKKTFIQSISLEEFKILMAQGPKLAKEMADNIISKVGAFV